MKKSFWAGVVSNQITFFSQNPEGNVEGLQGLRKFTVTDQCQILGDDNSNIVSSTSGGGSTDGATSAQQAGDTAQAEQSQSQGGAQTA